MFLKRYIPLLMLALLLTYPGNLKTDEKHNPGEHTSFSLYKPSRNILKTGEMISLFGGACGTGECSDWEHKCADGCYKFLAEKCQGVEGDCDNNMTVALCSCPRYADFIFGCVL